MEQLTNTLPFYTINGDQKLSNRTCLQQPLFSKKILPISLESKNFPFSFEAFLRVIRLKYFPFINSSVFFVNFSSKHMISLLSNFKMKTL